MTPRKEGGIEWINCESTCLARPWNFRAETQGGGRASLYPGLAIGGLVEAESISFLSRAIPLPREDEPLGLPARFVAGAEASGFDEEVVARSDFLYRHFKGLVFVEVHEGVAGPNSRGMVACSIFFKGDAGKEWSTSFRILFRSWVKVGDFGDFGEEVPGSLDRRICVEFPIPAELVFVG